MLFSNKPIFLWCIDKEKEMQKCFNYRKRYQDCGKMFFANSKDNQTTRCKECQHERDKELNRISSKKRMQKYRNKL